MRTSGVLRPPISSRTIRRSGPRIRRDSRSRVPRMDRTLRGRRSARGASHAPCPRWTAGRRARPSARRRRTTRSAGTMSRAQMPAATAIGLPRRLAAGKDHARPPRARQRLVDCRERTAGSPPRARASAISATRSADLRPQSSGPRIREAPRRTPGSRDRVSTSSRRISPSDGNRYAPFSSPRERHPPFVQPMSRPAPVDREGEPEPFRERARPCVLSRDVASQP